MKTKIYYFKKECKRINSGDWEYRRKTLKVDNPLGEEHGDYHPDSLTGEMLGLYKYVGEIDVEDPRDAFMKLQNAYESHELNNRSFSIGDVAVGEDGTVWLCSSQMFCGKGWYELNGWKKEFFLNFN